MKITKEYSLYERILKILDCEYNDSCVSAGLLCAAFIYKNSVLTLDKVHNSKSKSLYIYLENPPCIKLFSYKQKANEYRTSPNLISKEEYFQLSVLRNIPISYSKLEELYELINNYDSVITVNILLRDE